MTQRILFVDDDPDLLAGLRNLLRRDRQRWDMVFADSGATALAAIQHAPVDVVVTDMRMPGMDGAELLARIKHEYPETTRMVLSGQSDRAGVERAIPVTHQFLTKPCDGEVLRAALERTLSLRTLLLNDDVRRVVGEVEKLPSVPSLYWELMAATARGDVGTAEVAAIVERDPAMTAKLLQIVNSAYYGVATEITSVQRAVAYLGLEQVRALTLTAGIFTSPSNAGVGPIFLEGLQYHSLVVGRLAKRLAAGGPHAEQAFTAGLLHDIGKVVIAMVRTPHQPAPDESAGPSPATLDASLLAAERARLGVTHAEVGAYLLGVWGVPLSITSAVAYHHAPRHAPAEDAELVALVHAANAYAHGSAHGVASEPLDDECLAQLVIDGRQRRWADVAGTFLPTLPGW